MRNPGYTWNWIEDVTLALQVTQKRNDGTILNTSGEVGDAAKATAPVQSGNAASQSWSSAPSRTCPSIGVMATNYADGTARPLPTGACPPPSTRPTMSACPIGRAHNQQYRRTVQSGLSQELGCPSGYYGDRQRIWDIDHAMWCFDRREWDRGDAGETNVRYNNNCRPIVNGSCGSSPGACASGTRVGFGGSVTTGYSWTCQGDHGNNDTCGINPVCTPQGYQKSCGNTGAAPRGGADNDTRVTVSLGTDCAPQGAQITAHSCCWPGMPSNQVANPTWYGNLPLMGCDAPTAPACTTIQRSQSCADSGVGGTGTVTINSGTTCVPHGDVVTGHSGCCWRDHYTDEQTDFGNTLYGCNPRPSAPVCNQTPDTETTACGAGFTGNQYRTYTHNTGNVCGVDGNWSGYDRSQCVAIAPTYDDACWASVGMSDDTPNLGKRQRGWVMPGENRWGLWVAGDYNDLYGISPPGGRGNGTGNTNIIAVGAGAHLEIWNGKNFTGSKVLDIHGPKVIGQAYMEGYVGNGGPNPMTSGIHSSDVQVQNITWPNIGGKNNSMRITCDNGVGWNPGYHWWNWGSSAGSLNCVDGNDNKVDASMCSGIPQPPFY